MALCEEDQYPCKPPSDQHLVDVAPSPRLARLERFDYGVAGRAEVFGSVLVPGGVTASYMTAGQALTQVDPGIPYLETLLAPLR